ncbi:class I SAM-dependent methyltransferase [Bradyrhizobium sp. AC87j1]|uniref:class I SAM-dependent methyltransferase n=1 Tax=Bradyrhizobium sp. AC87j1 TaxID=2055894 RepID=UPI001374F846|nr:class I SAM-dependent methyltransferase [Bradyrhizobium sp. AC87j1]
MQPLINLVLSAWHKGAEIDLDGIGYGRIHWGNKRDIKRECSSYYRLLSGLAAVTNSKSAFEVGTHWGGSALSIYRGLQHNSDKATVVTVDITTESDNFIPAFNGHSITKLVGDANSQEVVSAVTTLLPTADFMFIDAAHAMMPTLSTFAIYEARLRPRVIAFDDIQFNDEMRSFWQVIRKGFGTLSIDVSDFLPEARDRKCGFGILVLPRAAPDLLSSV